MDIDCFPLISVIVPVFNTQAYLERCITSILNQTYRNIELVLVDDGSTDNSGAICDEYSVTNSRVVVVHTANKGQASARNRGYTCSSGKYIGFVDSDDWINIGMYNYLYSMIVNYSGDSSEIQYQEVLVKEENSSVNGEAINVLTGKEILQYYMDSSTRYGNYSVCTCLFSRAVVDSIAFREGKFYEDIDYKYKVLSLCKRHIVSSNRMYYYFQRLNSTSYAPLETKDFDLYDAAMELCKLSENETSGTIKKLCTLKYARTAFSLLSRAAYFGTNLRGIDEEKVIKELLKEHRHNLRTLIFSEIPLSRKLAAVILAISFPLFKAVVYAYRKVRSVRTVIV